MKIGFNLLLWTGLVEAEHYPLLEKLKAAGYDGVELPLFAGDVAHYQEVGKVLADNGLEATAVTVIPDANHSPISANAEARERAVDRLKWAVDCSQAAGAQTLLGPYHQPLGEFTGEGPTEDEKSRAAEVHKQIAQYAQDAGVLCAIEYLNRCRIDAACRLLRERQNMTVTRVAMSCGFSSSQYFAAVFRRQLGCTPRTFRAEHT